MLTQYYVNKNTLKCPLNTITSKLPEKFHTYLFVLVLRVLFHSWESTRLSRVTGSDRGLDAEIRAQLASRSCTAPDYAASSASPFRTHRSHWHLDFVHRFHLESLWFRTIRRAYLQAHCQLTMTNGFEWLWTCSFYIRTVHTSYCILHSTYNPHFRNPSKWYLIIVNQSENSNCSTIYDWFDCYMLGIHLYFYTNLLFLIKLSSDDCKSSVEQTISN